MTLSWKTGIFGLLLLAVTQVSGAENEKLAFWNEQRRGANGDAADTNKEWFRAARKAGIEFVRLSPAGLKPARRDILLGDADRFTGIPPKDLESLVKVLDDADRHDMKIVLTTFSLPGARWRQHNDNEFDYRLWEDAGFHEQAADFWREIATALRDHPAIVGYNLLNEPHPERKDGIDPEDRDGLEAWMTRTRDTTADLDAFYRTVVDAIREVDESTPIVLDGRFHASPEGIRSIAKVDDLAVMYSFHFYEPWTYTTYRVNKERFSYPDAMPGPADAAESWTADDLRDHMRSVREWANTNEVPANRILVGEFGCDRRVNGAANYLADVIDGIDANKWHWAFYSYRSRDWDGMDYELGTEKLSWKYWEAREAGSSHESLITREPNPVWNAIADRLPVSEF